KRRARVRPISPRVGEMSGGTEGGNVERKHQGRNDQAATSAATFIATILSGSCTGSPRLILSTFSIPSITWPQIEYCRLRKPASSKQMKNCELAEFGFWARAIEQVPRPWFMFENSAWRSGLLEPPMPARRGS